MQRRWAALHLRRLRLMRSDAANDEESGAAASEVQPDASAFGMQHLQPVDGGGGGADDSDGSLAPYGQDDSDYTSDEEVGFTMLCTVAMHVQALNMHGSHSVQNAQLSARASVSAHESCNL
jgi:hypothetical protein